MSTQLRLRRGNALQHTTFTGALAEVTYNTSNGTVHAHDGSTAGGFELATKADLANVVAGAVDLSGYVLANAIANVATSGDYADLSNTPTALADTNDLAEGTANLYFTNTRAIAALTGGDNITIEANGLIVGAAAGNVSLTDTDDLPEGSANLYFTNTRARTAVIGLDISAFINDAGYLTSANVSINDTDDVPEGTANLYFTNTRAIAALTGGDNITIEANGLIVGAAAGGNVTLTDTDDLPEGSANLYFTNTRAIGAFTAGSGIDIAANGQIVATVTAEPFTGNTDSVDEGVNNLYFTNARAITALTGQNISVNSVAANVIDAANVDFNYAYGQTLDILVPNVGAYGLITPVNVGGLDDLLIAGYDGHNIYMLPANGDGNVVIDGGLDMIGNVYNIYTTDLIEGNKLFFTNARAIAALTGGDNITIEANGLIIGAAGGNVSLTDTDDLPEGTANLYFTNTRAILSVFPAVTQLTVTTPVFNYNLDQYSGDNPEIYVTAGETIAFDLNQTSSHPFAIRVSDGGSNYDTGLTHIDDDGTISTGSAAQGKYTGKLFWKIPYNLAGNTYVYQCTNHSSMVGNIVISNPAAVNSLTDTDDLPEGSANLYFTNTRAIAALTGGDNITIEANGLIVGAASGNLSTTDDLTEGANNLYFTNARAIAAFTAGSGIDIAANGQIVSTVSAGSSYSDSNVETYLGTVGASIIPDGNTYNLGESTNVWNNLHVSNIYIDGSIVGDTTGVPTIESDTNINLTANDAVVISSSPLQLASFTFNEIQNIAAANGMLVFNTTNVKIQAYVNGGWVDLH